MEEPRARVVFLLLVTIFVCLHVCTATEYDHKYAVGDTVMLWVNKVGPYNNPQETYNYYSLPFCKSGKGAAATHKWGGLGEVLEGNELIDSEIEIQFKGKILLLVNSCSHSCSTHETGETEKKVQASILIHTYCYGQLHTENITLLRTIEKKQLGYQS
jgi:hypothetical protein